MRWRAGGGCIARAEERASDTERVTKSAYLVLPRRVISIRQQQPGANPAFFRLELFVNQLKRIRRNLERIKTPGGSIPRVSPVVFVTVENTRAQELGTRRNASRTEWRTIRERPLGGEVNLHFARSDRLSPKYLYARLSVCSI